MECFAVDRACPFITKTASFESAVTNQQFTIRDLIDCKSKGVVYMAKCPCPKNYIGKMKHEFRRRIPDHMATHVWEYHNGDPKSIMFCAIELVRTSPRGGYWDTQILQNESRWIYRLRSMSPCGLNEQLSFSCFI